MDGLARPSARPFIRPVGGTAFPQTEQKGEEGKGQGVWNGDGPYPPRTEKKAYSDPWNIIKPSSPAPLGRAKE